MDGTTGTQDRGARRPADVARALVGVHAADLAAVSDADLLELVRGAEEVGRVVDAARVLLAGEVERRSRPSLGADRLCARYGCRNAAELIVRLTNVSRRTATDRIRLAEPLMPSWSLVGDPLPAVLPELSGALETGTLGVDATRTVARALTSALSHGADPVQVGVAEAELVGAATRPPDDGDPTGPCGPGPGMAADQVGVMAQVWQAYLDPDGAAPDEGRGLQRRGITLGRRHKGTVSLRGELLPEVAAQLQRLFDAYLSPRVEQTGDATPTSPDGSTTSTEGADRSGGNESEAVLRPPPGPLLDREGRTHAQRRHDALAGILTVAAGHDDVPRLGGAAPTLVVTVSAEDLDDPLGAAFIQGGDPLDTPVGTGVARHVACSGATQVVALDARGRLVGMGSPHRVFTPHQRRAITLRDGACIIPGCDVRATWCEIHHVTPHHRGGPTHTDNGVLLCWFHHRTLDDTGWQITMEGGLPRVIAPPWLDPDGWPRTSPGSRHRQWQRHRATHRAQHRSGAGTTDEGDDPA